MSWKSNIDPRLGLSERRLVYLQVAASLGSVRAAADSLGVEPSVVSRQIQQLERDLGIQLLERHGRGVTPTEAGAMVVSYCEEKRSIEALLLSHVEELKGLQRGDVSIAASEGFLQPIIESVLQDFCTKYPGIRIGLESMSVTSVLDRVARDQAHIGLAFAPPLHHQVEIRRRRRHPICVIARRDHPLARFGRTVEFENLLEYPFALVPPEFGVGLVTGQAEAASGASLRRAMVTNSLDALKHFVRAGLGLTLLPRITIENERDRRSLIALSVRHRSFETTEARILTRANRVPSRASELLLEMLGRMAWFEPSEI